MRKLGAVDDRTATWEEHVSELIRPDDLPKWVPGELTLDSAPLGWDGIRLRGYRYAGSDVSVPPLQDYMIVIYRQGATPMYRRCDGAWRSATCAPGSASLLTQAVQSHWRWTEPVEVSHLYLSPQAVADVAVDVFEREIGDIELMDLLKTEDSALTGVAEALTQELRGGGFGGRLYVDALRTQACVHILRNYANVVFRSSAERGRLGPATRKRVERHIEDNLHRTIGLAELASLAGLSSFHFAHKFRREFGCPPHAFVIHRRLDHARRQLARTNLPLKCIAANAGFADQSHMTRHFRQVLGCTPAAYRGSVAGGRERPSDPGCRGEDLCSA